MPLNRTLLELKHSYEIDNYIYECPLNRTLLELKLEKAVFLASTAKTSQSNLIGIETACARRRAYSLFLSQSNLIGIETKELNQALAELGLSIEPYWN